MKKIVLCVLFAVLGFTACSKNPKNTLSPVTPAVDTPTTENTTESLPLVDASLKNLGPMEAIKDLDKKLDTYKTGANLTPEEQKQNESLKQQVIRGTFDVYELCRLALDTHWNEIDDKERTHFSNLMIRLLEKKAIFSKEQVKGESKAYKVIYNQEKYLDAEKTKSLVTTKVLVPSKKVDLNLNYQLLSTPNGWKIYDVIVDEASLVENYKFQFNTIIKKSGYQDLLDRMEKKLKEME